MFVTEVPCPTGYRNCELTLKTAVSCCASRDSLRRNYVICEECMTLKVLFIGGTGQISLPCVRAAIEAGHQVTVFNRGIRGEPLPEGVELITGDTDDIHAYAKLANRDWHVVNQFLARTTDLVERDISLFAGRTGQYVFISSASVYHKTPFDGRLAETTRIGNPFWSYSQAKIRSEEMIRSAVDLPYTIVRPSQTVRTAMPTMLNEGDSVALRMLADKPVIVAGDGTSLWTLTRSEDIARPFVRLFGNPGALGEDFHITSDNGYTWDAIYSVIARALGVDIKIVHVPSDVLVRYHPEWQGPLFGDKTLTTLFDNTKIKMLAGDFACESDLEKVLAAPIRFLKKRLEAGIQKDPAIEALSDRIVGDIERLAR
nr:NAD-dependent epimerase/dehydratase family protein [Agrobacterium tumefaciens]